MLNCLGELNLTYCLIYLDDVIIFSRTEEEHLEQMRVVFDRFWEHGLKLKPSKCEVFKTEVNHLAHHVSKRGVLPSKKNLEAIAQCPPPDTYTKVKSFVGLVGHYRHFIKGFANITAPLYDLTSGENKDKKSEHLDLPQEAREAFDRLKAACLQAPILAFPDFDKPFLLETDASGKGLGAVLLQKQSDGRYHPIAYPGVKAVLDNAITPLTNRAEQGVRPNPNNQKAGQEVTIGVRLARLATTNITDWKLEQQEDPVLYQVVKHRKASRETFKEALLKVTDRKAVSAYAKSKDQLIMKNGLLYRQSKQGQTQETVLQFVVPQIHRNAALDGCHHEAAHQGQSCSLSLMQEQFWWPGMARDLRNCIRKCGHCKKFEAASPIAPLKPLACSGLGELLHVDFTSIEETVPLCEEPVIRNVMVMQDHFSKYVVTYVVKDQMARTAAETLRNGYFGLFGAPAYLVSDQGKAFTGHLISNLCELYGVQKLRTLPYHAQTNGQVERMNQTIIRMIGKLEQDKKAHWSEHLPEMLAAYNGTHSAVTGYSPYFLLFGRKSRMPVDCLFPILHDSPHQAKMEVSVAAMQKRLKEAFTVARHLTSQEAARQRCYYDCKAGAVALQPGDVVMVRTDGFVGKRKVKDQWEDGGFIVESQLEDWPVYKVRCPTSDAKQKPKYCILHRNHLLLVTNEDDVVVPGQLAQAKVSPVVLNATPEATVEDEGPSGPLPSLLTQQEGDMTSRVWLNGEFRTKPSTQMMSRAPESPPDQPGDEVSDLESGMLDSESEGM